MNHLHWGVWDETISLGAPEWKAFALAHAIILGIAVFRFAVLPRIRELYPVGNVDGNPSAQPPSVAVPLAEGGLVDRTDATDP